MEPCNDRGVSWKVGIDYGWRKATRSPTVMLKLKVTTDAEGKTDDATAEAENK
jgi:hypothetical protein